MTRELVEQRIAQLEQDEKVVWANLNAILGAIEDCKYWLRQYQFTDAELPQEREGA